MKCPTDNSDLTMSERQGIEIDYCPKCRGVWLDRGELDKIIERSETAAPEPPSDRGNRYGSGGRDDYRGGNYGHNKRKNNWLGELFD